MTTVNTHNLIVDFGKHNGERWTRLPLSYLKWILNEPTMSKDRKDIAQAEMERRGTAMPTTLELSGHAIDRASQMTCNWKEQGVYSWLLKIGQDALAEANGATEVEYQGFRFVFVYGDYYPSLKTIIKK